MEAAERLRDEQIEEEMKGWKRDKQEEGEEEAAPVCGRCSQWGGRGCRVVVHLGLGFCLSDISVVFGSEA